MKDKQKEDTGADLEKYFKVTGLVKNALISSEWLIGKENLDELEQQSNWITQTLKDRLAATQDDEQRLIVLNEFLQIMQMHLVQSQIAYEHSKATIIKGIRGILEASTISREDIATEFFWTFPRFNSVFVSEALGLNHHANLKVLARPRVVILPCTDCGRSVNINVTKRGVETKPQQCTPCRKAANARSNEEGKRHIAAITARRALLKSMPYYEYLLTPEWQEKRRDKLSQARYACQLCNRNNVSLQVHHRTYERVREEYLGDLIVLCGDCHAKFHNKLPKAAA